MLTDKHLLDYLNTVDWENEEDWFGDCLYVKEYLLEIYNGVSKETEEEYLGEIIAKVYHQEGVLPVLKKIIYPLIYLLSVDKIYHKAEVIELIIDVQEKYIYLQGTLGVMPVKYNYLGDVFSTKEEVESENSDLKECFFEIQTHIDLIRTVIQQENEIFHLVIKAYTLAVFQSNLPYKKCVDAITPVCIHFSHNLTYISLYYISLFLNKIDLPYLLSLNLKVTFDPELIIYNSLVSDVNFKNKCEALLEVNNLEYQHAPFLEGQISLLAAVNLLNNWGNMIETYSLLINYVKKYKNKREGSLRWNKGDILAEYIVATAFKDKLGSLKKVDKAELSDLQIEVFKLLKLNNIFTYAQKYAGLPEDKTESINYL